MNIDIFIKNLVFNTLIQYSKGAILYEMNRIRRWPFTFQSVTEKPHDFAEPAPSLSPSL